MIGKIVLLSGPSCVGKTPLIKAVLRLYPDKKIGKPVLYTSRQPRPIEREGIDYFFRSEKEIRGLDPQRFIIALTRHVWQAIDVEQVLALAAANEVVIYDVHPELIKRFRANERIRSALGDCIVRVFLQPATLDEIRLQQKALGDVSPAQAAAALMKPKLTARARQQGKELSPEVMADINIRANAAWEEILIGQEYEHIIINHDGEDSPNWREMPPVGDAGKALKGFGEIIFSE